MPFAVNEGVRIYWRLHGAEGRPPLVLLNGIGTEQALYDAAAPFLLRHFRLLRVDNRGHGASDAPGGDYSLASLVGDTLAVMDAAGIGKAVVCGTSLGAMIAMRMALDAPDRVSGLVLACTSAKMDPEFWSQRIATVRAEGIAAIADAALSRLFTEEFAAANPEPVGTARASLLGMEDAGYAGCGAAIRDMDLLPELPAIGVPTLVLAGEQDLATPFAGHGDKIAAAIPGAETAFLPTAHLACIERPEGFADCVLALAKRCDGFG